MIFRPDNKKLIYLFAAILWAGIIFYLSSIPDLASGLPSTMDLILRKVAHILEYFILTWLLLKSFHSHRRGTIYLAAGLAILYAISDEYHQNFVLGRNGNLQDILIDCVGIFLAVFFYKQKTLRYKRRVEDSSTLGF